MIHIGGVSLDTPAPEGTESTGDALGETLAAVSDDTDIERAVSCSAIEHDDGDPTSIETSDESLVVVTRKAVHALADGVETAAEDVETLPLTTIEDARSTGLVRRRLTITTDDGTYRIDVDGRPDLEGLARFLRRASWSWGRVAPRLETARTAITALETGLDERGPEDLEREKHRAKMALSKAGSSASRLDVAVDAIEAEIDRLRERLRRQQVRWHVLQGEDEADAGEEKLSRGFAHAARPLFERARDHFEQALSIAREAEGVDSKRIRHRLEEIRERLYDLEVEPAVEAHEAVQEALAADEPETAVEHWEAAREGYERALEGVTDPAPIRFQLAWVDANVVRACREYAAELAADADEHTANGHEQWARQLYMAANDQLLNALAVASDQPNLDIEPIETQHEQLGSTDADESFEWPAAEAATDT